MGRELRHLPHEDALVLVTMRTQTVNNEGAREARIVIREASRNQAAIA